MKRALRCIAKIKEQFRDGIMICHENWIFYDNHRRSRKWLYYNEALKHIPKQKLHQTKIMISIWWSAAGVICEYYNILNPGEKIAAEKYCSKIDEIRQNLREKQPILVNRKGPISFMIIPDNRFNTRRSRN
jgi:histone-lysine N-methyltransferase SETMAR